MAAHTALAKQLGVTEELLDALYHIDQHSHLFTDRELVALRFAEIMTTSARDVDEELWDALQAYFDDGEIVEIGSFKGKSTVMLASVAAHYGRGKVVAIDPHTAPARTDPTIAAGASTFEDFLASVGSAGLAEQVEIHRAPVLLRRGRGGVPVLRSGRPRPGQVALMGRYQSQSQSRSQVR